MERYSIKEAQDNILERGQKAIWFDTTSHDVYFADFEDVRQTALVLPGIQQFIELSERELLNLDTR